MFSVFETVRNKVNDVTDSVAAQFNSESEEEDGSEKRNSFMDDLKKLAEDANSTVSQFFSDVDDVDTPDDLHGYDLSSDDEDEDTVSAIPLIKKQYHRSDHNSTQSDELGETTGEALPGYALSNAYVKPEEVLQRRVTTTRRITEANLDKNSPLYRNMDQINYSEKCMERKKSTDDEGLLNNDSLRPDSQRLLQLRAEHGQHSRKHVEIKSHKPLKPLPYLDLKFAQHKHGSENHQTHRYQGQNSLQVHK